MEEQKEAVKNEVKRKDPRFERRLKARKQEILNTMVNLFFTERSSLKDPEGEEADAIFIKYRNMWIAECKAFNKPTNRPFTLRGNAFTDQVDKILKMEKANQKKANEERQYLDFNHWIRRSAGWKHMFFHALWYWIKTRGNKDKQLQCWKHCYITTQ